jgi:nucleolar protein 6
MSDSDSDYNVEEYIKPEVIRHTYNNDDPISDLENSDNQESLSENEDGISDKLKCSKTNNDEEKDVGENIEEPVRTNSRNILHVSNLEFGTTKEDLYEVFKEAGDMKGIRVPKGRKGFAFVEMKNEEGLKVRKFFAFNKYIYSLCIIFRELFPCLVRKLTETGSL